MQLIGIDAQGQRVIALSAQKQIDYHCPTCNELIRLRGGTHTQPHFYHYRKPKHCPHRKKSLAHLQNQLYLATSLPTGEAILEHPFPSIGRIADVFWPAQNIIFEIQCSPMTMAEAEKRESDYGSLGLTVIWILHEARYNRRRLSSAEQFFASRHTYYTSIITEGKGMIYDQFEIICNNERRFKGAKFAITPSLPYRLHDKTLSPSLYPKIFYHRLQTRKLGFVGDMLDRAFRNLSYDYSSLISLENRYAKRFASLQSPLRMWTRQCISVYRAFLYALLEKTLIR